METVLHGRVGRGLVFAAVLAAFVAASTPGALASPLATSYFTASDFSTSGLVVINASLVDDFSDPSRETQENGGIGPLGVGDHLQFGVVGAPASGEMVASATGSAGLALHAQTYSSGSLLGGPQGSDLANVAGFALSQAQFGLTNMFVAVPRAEFGGDEAVIRFVIATRGAVVANTDQDYPGTAEASSYVRVGVSLTQPGCPGCIADYDFEDLLQLAVGQDDSRGYGINDEYVIEAVIPVGVPITVDAGLFVQSFFRGNAPRASSALPAGSAAGESGANFSGSLLFGVTSTDAVDFVWASDLYFDSQPSVTQPVAVPAPPTLALLAGASTLLMLVARRRTRRRSGP